MITRILTHRDLGREYSNGFLTQDITYYLPSPRLGDSFTIFVDAPYNIYINTNDPQVPILSNHGPDTSFVLEGKETTLGNSIILKCNGSAWRVIPRFF